MGFSGLVGNLKAALRPQMRVGGREVPAHLRGELVAHEGPLTTAALASTLEHHGYVLLRAGHGGLPRAEVEAAADEVFGALHAVDEVEAPPNHRTATGRSERLAKHPDLNEFWQGVCQGPALRRVSHGAELQQLVSLTMGEESRPFDLMYLRPTPPGEGTPPHADFTFFATCKADTAMLNACALPHTAGSPHLRPAVPAQGCRTRRSASTRARCWSSRTPTRSPSWSRRWWRLSTWTRRREARRRTRTA